MPAEHGDRQHDASTASAATVRTRPASLPTALALAASLRPILFRAPTDNDRGPGLGTTPKAELWEQARLGLLDHRVAELPDGLAIVSGVPSRQRLLRTALRWTPGADGLDVVATFAFTGDWPVLPRIGLTLALPASAWAAASVTWFGLGPGESYPDMAGGVRLGTFTGAVDDLWTPRIRPQEAGRRGGVRHLRLDGDAELEFEFLPVGETWPSFGLCRWTPQQINRARHPEELPTSDTVWLTLDAAHRGVGTAACGPDVAPEWEVHPLPTTLRFRLRASAPHSAQPSSA